MWFSYTRSVFMHPFNKEVYYGNKIKDGEVGRGCGIHRKEDGTCVQVKYIKACL